MQSTQQESIAIVGIGCRFPAANNPQAFWDLLCQGKDAIREVPAERWNIEQLYDPDPNQPGKMMSRWGGFLDAVDQFDWRAFRMLPREVLQMDPQQRLLLEVAWEALEDAGLPLTEIAGTKTSVTIGIGWSDYLRLATRNWSAIDGYTAMGNATCFAANRLSYFFNLKGPSLSLDTGCSSSLAALSLACQSLWNGDAEMAIAGGVNLILAPDSTIMVSKAGLLSSDGHCKTLDAHADGFVRGEGAGVLVLKPLSQVRAADRVYAHIRAVTLNHNGHNEWIIATSQQAQQELLHEAYLKAGVSPAEVGYVELHGTGFHRGDAIEAKALGAVLGAHPHRHDPCLIGSVKTNIGHLEAASGIASVIKVALSLYHRKLPPTLNLQELHPDIPLHDLHLAVPQTPTEWPGAKENLAAGVTTLAFTGANAHAVLTNHIIPQMPPSSQAAELPIARLLTISARTEDALYAQVCVWKDFLRSQSQNATHSWKDICYTASVRRTHHEYRLATVCCQPQEAADVLDTLLQQPLLIQKPRGSRHKVLFLFAQTPSFSSLVEYEFLLRQPVFRAMLDECDQLLQQLTIFSALENVKSACKDEDTPFSALEYFVIQISLAALWKSWGIVPEAVIGEGLGELAAACACGALALKDTLHLIVQAKADTISQVDLAVAFKKMPLLPTKTALYSISRGCLNETERVLSSPAKKQGDPPTLSLPDQLLADGYDVFVEIGFPSSLSETLSVPWHHQKRHGTFLSSLHAQKGVNLVLLEALSSLYLLGYALPWSLLYAQEACFLASIPTYSWQRERLWPTWLTPEEVSTPPEKRSGVFLEAPSSHTQAKERETADRSSAEILADLWADILGLKDVQPQDNFFELGGHSLLAMQLLAGIQKALAVEISLSDLFRAPTLAACTNLVVEAKQSGTALLVTNATIEPAPAQQYHPFPTTDMQQAYWVGRNATFETGKVGNHAYIEVEAVALDLDRFTQAIHSLIKRHPMLRAILLPDGQQKVLEHVPPFEIAQEDLRQLEPEAREACLAHTRQQLDHQLLPVEQWPAFEIRVSRLNDQRIRLHVSIESLFIDAWSMNILIQECIRFYYEPFLSLPPLELSFRDYLLAEEALQDSDLYRRSQHYWLERLATLPPAPDLPLAPKKDGAEPPHFIHREARLEKAQWQQMKAQAVRCGLTPSAILLAAFVEVLGTWNKTRRFSINLSTFNRLPLHPQVKSIVGDFTSLLVLAVDHTAPGSFEQRARQLQEQLWQDLDHSRFSGIRVLRELVKRQGGGTQAIMPIVFTSLLIQDTASPLTPPWQEIIYAVSQTPQVWLDHQVLESAGDLVFHWQSVDAIFPEKLIDTLFQTYCQLLQQLATSEESWYRPVQVVPSQQLEQRRQINATAAPISEQLLHTLFSAQVLQHPTYIAVSTPTKKLTYQEVNNGMLQLGHQLRRWGARRNQLVGVVMEKGWEQVIAVLGILQAGAAYLPIDATLPQARIEYLLEHAEVEIVLTQSWIDRQIPWQKHLKRITVDHLNMNALDTLPLETVQQPEDLAYVIYTSGSTGFPKGVMIDHRGAVNTILDINQRFGVNEHDRVLALSALNFDLSVYDIFGTLAAGGTIVLPPEGSIRSPDVWLETLVREKITIWNSVPALLHMFVEYAEVIPEIFKQNCLRLVLLSGDWLPVSLPDRLRKFCASVDIISLGGATEASIWSILYPIAAVDPSWKSIPYGKPMLNQSFSILNEALEPCPIWVPGHLYIAGIGLAKGYWRDEEKTQASFINHPVTGERLYRTGDLGRYLPDGTIEFLGREDFQVKILGHRIELGEIEAVLLQHPAVQTAIVTTVSETPGGEKRLVAYVVVEGVANAEAEQVSAAQEERPAAYTLQQLQKEYAPETNQRTSLPEVTSATSETGHVLQRLELQFGQASIRKDIDTCALELLPARSSLVEKYRERLSYRRFLSQTISFEQFSHLLGSLSQMELEGLPKYRYASAGGLYGVQVYLSIKPGGIEGIAGGVYYYNPQAHQLLLLADTVELEQPIHALINQPIFRQSAFSLFLIGDLALVMQQYAAAAEKFCLLEAGYMAQLLMTCAPEYFIGFCPIGGLDFDAIRHLFKLKTQQVFLHCLLGGKIDPAAAKGWSFLPESTLAPTSTGARPLHPVTATDLRDFLKAKLPEYMLPSSILFLDTLPLTSNGKVDRKNLPAPESVVSVRERKFALPQSELEQTIAAVWQELLPTEHVGVHDNFFDLGGNSVLMVRAYTKLRPMLHRDISLVEMFFQYSTIHALAEFLTQDIQVRAAEQQNAAMVNRQTAAKQQQKIRLEHRARDLE